MNAGLGGCEGFASGTELIALMVQGYTGIEIDHVARVTFDGFASVVNALGGVNVCTDHPARDPRSGSTCREAALRRRLHDSRLGQVPAHRAIHRRNLASRGRVRLQPSVQAARCTVSGWRASWLRSAPWAPSTPPWPRWRERFGSTRDGHSRMWLRLPGDIGGLPETVSIGSRSRCAISLPLAGAYVLAPTRSFNELLAEVYPPAAHNRAIGQDGRDESDRDRPRRDQDRGSRPGYRRHRTGEASSTDPFGRLRRHHRHYSCSGRGDGCVMCADLPDRRRRDSWCVEPQDRVHQEFQFAGIEWAAAPYRPCGGARSCRDPSQRRRLFHSF